MNTLSIRETNTYVGSYRDLDKWRGIGTYRIASTQNSHTDGEDICEPMTHLHRVEVWSSVTDEEIRKALSDEFTRWGCAHDWDCCGCRNYAAREVRKIAAGLWEVEVHSLRNY